MVRKTNTLVNKWPASFRSVTVRSPTMVQKSFAKMPTPKKRVKIPKYLTLWSGFIYQESYMHKCSVEFSDCLSQITHLNLPHDFIQLHEKTYHTAAPREAAPRMRHTNQGKVYGCLYRFLNFRMHRSPNIPKNMRMPSIRMKRDCAKMALSAKLNT